MNDHYNPWQRYERHRRAKVKDAQLPLKDYLRCMAISAAFTIVAMVIFITR